MDITPDEARAELARRELTRRGIPVDQPLDYKKVVGSAIQNAFMQPGTTTRKLATDPITQAQALPELAGFVGALSPVPGGATLGTVPGRQLSNMALRSYGRADLIPSGGAQLAEGVLSGLGDIAAIPGLKKASYGRQIGKIEKMAGVPAAHDIPSIPMATGAKTTGEFINDAVSSVKSSGGQGTPSYWLQIKDQVDRLYRMGKDEALTTLDKGRLKWLSQQVQKGLNAAVPGRGVPAQALAKSQTIPRFFGNAYKAIPAPIKKVLGVAGAGGAGSAGWHLISQLLGK